MHCCIYVHDAGMFSDSDSEDIPDFVDASDTDYDDSSDDSSSSDDDDFIVDRSER